MVPEGQEEREVITKSPDGILGDDGYTLSIVWWGSCDYIFVETQNCALEKKVVMCVNYAVCKFE